jgi:hypothetical protein
MTTAGDPLGVLAERNRLINYQAALVTQLFAWTGDTAGAADLRTKLAEVNYRLNTSSTLTGLAATVTTLAMPNAGGTDVANGFIMEKVSTS